MFGFRCYRSINQKSNWPTHILTLLNISTPNPNRHTTAPKNLSILLPSLRRAVPSSSALCRQSFLLLFPVSFPHLLLFGLLELLRVTYGLFSLGLTLSLALYLAGPSRAKTLVMIWFVSLCLLIPRFLSIYKNISLSFDVGSIEIKSQLGSLFW